MKSLTALQSVIAALLLTLGAIAADQFFAPALYTSSPLWATLGCLLLVWRSGESAPNDQISGRFSFARIALFFATHFVLILASLWLHSLSLTGPQRFEASGWLFAALKLFVLAPTLLLFPLSSWRTLAQTYKPEFVAALFILFTFFPSRVMESIWPWYGQVLGRTVYAIAQLFAPVLAYHPTLTPTVSGPDLDVTILYACSGFNGLELFDILFALVVFVDWKRLAKTRALMVYFVGLVVMLFSNALRIASLFILGNRGFADFVARFHISAGWIFFTIAFFVYLTLIYRRILIPQLPVQAKGLALHEVLPSAPAE